MTAPTLEPLDRRPTVDLVADSIRSNIVAGAFAPGAQLTETSLADQLGVSRGPIREALQRLVQEGILVAEPHRGVFVATIDAEAAADLYTARRAIEREAARIVVRQGDPVPLRRLDAIVKEMAVAARGATWSAIADLDLSFHEALVGSAGSPRLTRMYGTLLVETRLCFADLPITDPDPKRIVAEHRALVKALRSGDEAAVLDLVDRHLDRATASR